ncbi:hypothetical protein Vdis_1494 [Vulcanisaeta distributa DSM 14429]|uniref:Uncharacterized protein n=1 Tax=Vulcanisaeta distributa (strain DSM 14429 / JCM 11212 / NBRC 100878 / IC-017) TaxID=572478 RepID=E1QT13_VULDI|nr:hypothetical protein Vdis_1494 [Vulcanisaeta distributa DSM 14429]
MPKMIVLGEPHDPTDTDSRARDSAGLIGAGNHCSKSNVINKPYSGSCRACHYDTLVI